MAYTMHHYTAASSTAPLTAPHPAEAMQRFLETEDLSRLEKPLVCETNQKQWKKMMCCQSAILNVATWGFLVPFCPIKACAPFTYANEFSLKLDKDSIMYTGADNDCCCHIAKTLKTVPLEKVQDVELKTNCLLSCFGLKAVNVQTAGQGGTPFPEISALFLKDPEKVREALQLAVKLYRQQGGGAGAGGPPGRAPVAAWAEVQVPAAKGGKSRGSQGLAQRLPELEGLVTRGVLGRAEADGLKVCVLAAPDECWLSRLGEAADLRDGGLISSSEFEQLKTSLIAQLRAAALQVE